MVTRGRVVVVITARTKTTVTPDAVAVAAADITTVVALVTEAIVVLAGIPAPVTLAPTSLEVKAAVAEVRVVEVLVVAPLVKVRDSVGPMISTVGAMLNSTST